MSFTFAHKTFSFSLFYAKYQLDVVKNKKWVDVVNDYDLSILEMPSKVLEHFFKVPISLKVWFVISKFLQILSFLSWTSFNFKNILRINRKFQNSNFGAFETFGAFFLGLTRISSTVLWKGKEVGLPCREFTSHPNVGIDNPLHP